MRPIRDDALLRDVILDEQRFSAELRTRRAKAITRCESPDILAFYDRHIMETDQRLNELMGRKEHKKSR